jgi:hypothetical protein
MREVPYKLLLFCGLFVLLKLLSLELAESGVIKFGVIL